MIDDTPARRFDAVLFDFGGVFIDSPFAVADAAAAELGIEPEVLTDVVFGSYHIDSDHPWHRLERGEMSFDDCRAAIIADSVERGLIDVDPFAVLGRLAAGGATAVRGFMVDAVRSFRAAGLKVGIVTNNIAEFGSYWRSLIPLDELFDDVLDSCEVGVRKPNTAIYLLACERLGVEPSRTLFVDDHLGNVEGARRAGLTAVCCGTTVESTIEALAELQELAG